MPGDGRVSHTGESSSCLFECQRRLFLQHLDKGQFALFLRFRWTPYANKDGFAGINQQYYVSSFPMGGALAMTWDKDHFEAEAKAAGKEFYDMGSNGK